MRQSPVYWGIVYRRWVCGFIEFSEAVVFSWRRDFRPFPWRGVRRGRRHQ